MTRQLLRLLPLMLQLGFVGGCVVPQARFDEARSALAVEQEAHRRTNAELYQVSQKVQKLEQALAEREQKIGESLEQLAARELAENVAISERDAATQTVEQLRGELARVGDHLRAFADQKKTLSVQLDEAETRAKRVGELEKAIARRTLIVRDVSLLLNEAITMGEVELELKDGHPVLSFEHRSAFVAGSGDLQPGTSAAASALARAMRPHPETRIRLVRRARDEKGATLELKRIVDALISAGVQATQIESSVEKASGDEGPIEVHVL